MLLSNDKKLRDLNRDFRGKDKADQCVVPFPRPRMRTAIAAMWRLPSA